MGVWSLDVGNEFTEFYFPLEEDKNFFHDAVKNYFEQSKPLFEKWNLLYMIRGEPLKHPDFYEIDHTDVIAISQRAVDRLEAFLKKEVELLPIETDSGRYYALNVLNFVDCLNKEKSVYTSVNNNIIVSYTSLEFSKEKLGDNSIFKIPQLPYHTFVSDDIQEKCEMDDLRGLIFDTELNLIWDE